MSRLKPAVIALIVLLVILWAGDVFITHEIFTSRYPGANDFAGRYAGAHVFWTQGLSPYSDEATRQAQILLHGRTLTPDEVEAGVLDVTLFAYPFYMVFWLAPVAILPYDWAEAVWLVTLEFALVGGVIGAISLARWKPPVWLLAITLVWSIFFYHSARAILLGQFAIIVFLLNVATLLALRSRYDVLAGVLLAISTTKPQMAFLIVPLVFYWVVARRRWRVVASFVVTMVILCGASFIILPGWVGDFVLQMLGYRFYTTIGSPVWIVVHLFAPAVGAPGEVVISLVLVVWMAVAWWHLWRDSSWSALMWAASLTLTMTNLVAFRTATTNYVVFLIPLLWALAAVQASWPRAGRWAVVVIQALLLLGIWALFLATLVGKQEHPIVYLPLPLGILAVLAFGRHWLMDYLTTSEA
jgi:hypothetical protein